MEIIFIGVAAFLGGIVAALLGWTETNEAFDARKFCSSLIRAIIAGGVIAVAFNYSEITLLSFLIAFLAGAGVDAGGNRIAGAISARVRNK